MWLIPTTTEALSAGMSCELGSRVVLRENNNCWCTLSTSYGMFDLLLGVWYRAIEMLRYSQALTLPLVACQGDPIDIRDHHGPDIASTKVSEAVPQDVQTP